MLNLENFATKVNNQAILWKPGHVCEHLGIRKNLIENEPPKWQGQSNPWVMRWRGVQNGGRAIAISWYNADGGARRSHWQCHLWTMDLWVGVTNHHMGCCYFIPFLSQLKWNKLAWHGGCGKSQNQLLAAWWHQTWLLFQMVILVS